MKRMFGGFATANFNVARSREPFNRLERNTMVADQTPGREDSKRRSPSCGLKLASSFLDKVAQPPQRTQLTLKIRWRYDLYKLKVCPRKTSTATSNAMVADRRSSNDGTRSGS
jgi:hypothetical protein